ncbi:murein hydrolase activator NlpD [Orbaceae bacterium ac157xtp]
MKTLSNIKNNKNLFKLFSVSFLALSVCACTQTNPAKINHINATSVDKNKATIQKTAPKVIKNNNNKPVYTPPPQNITKVDVEKGSYSNIKTDGSTITKTTQERIVYNRNYEEIPKGGYKGNTYVVRRGDTLFYIAWVTGNDFRSLAAKNNIKAPYDLNVGQELDVSGGTTVLVTTKETITNKPNKTQSATKTTTTTTTSSSANKNRPSTTHTVTTTTKLDNVTSKVPSSLQASIDWQWPAKGRIVAPYSHATKGIDIAGSLGDKVVSAADGKVVYAGNALPGYGNLIIVKHNDDYLTAYAHNQSILVKEQQTVVTGQQIATMGNTGTNSIRLHFELRYKANSVDPMKYLPARK